VIAYISKRKLMCKEKVSIESQHHSVVLIARWLGKVIRRGTSLTKNAYFTIATIWVVVL